MTNFLTILSLSLSSIAFCQNSGNYDTSFDGDGKLVTTNFTFDVESRTFLENNNYLTFHTFSNNGIVGIASSKISNTGTNVQSLQAIIQISTDAEIFLKRVVKNADGSFLLGYNYYIGSDDSTYYAVAKITSNLSLDNTWGNQGIAIVGVMKSFGQFLDFAPRSDGKIIVAHTENGSTIANKRIRIKRLNANGSLDSGGNLSIGAANTITHPHSIFVDGQNNTFISGSVINTSNPNNPNNYNHFIYKLNASNNYDTSFDGDGKIVFPIYYSSFGSYQGLNNTILSKNNNALYLLMPSSDTSSSSLTDFGTYLVEMNTLTGAIVNTKEIGGDNQLNKIIIDENQDLYLAGYKSNTTDFDGYIVKLKSDFTYDNSFDSDGRKIIIFQSNKGSLISEDRKSVV